MRTALYRRGRTATPQSVPSSRNSVSAAQSRGHAASRYSSRLTSSGRPGSPLQYSPNESVQGDGEGKPAQCRFDREQSAFAS
jgi:hypothetical protein